jgi:hypothetical protein
MPRDANQNWWEDWDLKYFPDVYGQTYGGHSVQQAIYNTLDNWLPTYIQEFNRQVGGGEEILKIPKHYRLEPENRTLSRALNAQVLVVCNGTVGEPEVHGDGTITAEWEAEVSMFVPGTKDWNETQAMTMAYGACARTAIMQHRGLDGFASTTRWVREQYRKSADHVAGRNLGFAVINFEVVVMNNMTVWGGPPLPQFAAEGENTGPTLSEQANFPTVSDVDVTIEHAEDKLPWLQK